MDNFMIPEDLLKLVNYFKQFRSYPCNETTALYIQTNNPDYTYVITVSAQPDDSLYITATNTDYEEYFILSNHELCWWVGSEWITL